MTIVVLQGGYVIFMLHKSGFFVKESSVTITTLKTIDLRALMPVILLLNKSLIQIIMNLLNGREIIAIISNLQLIPKCVYFMFQICRMGFTPSVYIF